MEVIDNVIQAYEAVKLNDVSKGIIALCTFVAIIIVILNSAAILFFKSLIH